MFFNPGNVSNSGNGGTGGSGDGHNHSNLSTLNKVTESKLREWNNKSNFSGNYNDLTNKPTDLATESYVNQEIEKTNAELSQLANEKYINQEDFIETIKRNYKPKSMNFKVNDFETKVFSIQNIINNEKAIQYSTRTASANSVQDGYILFGEGRYGTIDMQPVLTGRQSADELIGNWNTSYPPSCYATTVGDTMKKEFIGDRIDFLSFGDNRGGVWEFILDENIENKVTVSTWQATSGAKPLVTLFENLENKKHTLIGTFKGDEPQNPPSSGTGTSRGWT